jgi:hypothetical protein
MFVTASIVFRSKLANQFTCLEFPVQRRVLPGAIQVDFANRRDYNYFKWP